MNDERWLLPTGIEEVLPARAAELERLRRCLLDLYQRWGYELVIPPFIDYLDSLLTGTGRDLDLQTFKLTDQLSGRMLGVRADMTPQVARIDAHHLRREISTRLCYLGTVLHTRTDGFAGTRSPLQIGAEIYGHDGPASDVEVLRLLVRTLETAGIESPHLDLGHVGIYRGLIQQAGLTRADELRLFDALQRKASAEIEAIIAETGVAGPVGGMLLSLVELNGEDALTRASSALRAADPQVLKALERLKAVAEELSHWLPGLPVHFDLAELRGYTYKTGVVFAAFAPGWGLEIARGGRYDDIGQVFGRARPAVGFSADLKGLIALSARAADDEARPGAVLVPWDPDPALQRAVEHLRAQGRQVLHELPGQRGTPRDYNCCERLAQVDGVWQLVPDEAL
ncbi:ATP phosphoribosyltransferase regulatory subunit [Halochromatium salexigens]|uniref:ATP phosphoribosyltransferase regulatory subunit n=1 Tax=Halochromatium salexigens TaxID=49447 RepID=A0AAJ0UDR1_HALSE|nr:ATP phosphoribosyltransferase regulatory subunit [Halochromatium salexigens]MBK5929562.1 ATP phosphoribosyltransferase regulatory subunit [Halochromatium salexigens]